DAGAVDAQRGIAEQVILDQQVIDLPDEGDPLPGKVAGIKVEAPDGEVAIDAVAARILRRGKDRPSAALVAAAVLGLVHRVGRVIGLDDGRILRAVAALVRQPRNAFGIARALGQEYLVARLVGDASNRRRDRLQRARGLLAARAAVPVR